MGRLGFVASKQERRGSCRECGGPEALEPEFTKLASAEDDDEAGMLGSPRRHRSQEPCGKTYLLYFTCTMAIFCFCIFVVAPQLIDYFINANGLEMKSRVVYPSQQPPIELREAERSERNQERLDIMRRFDALQQKYRELQVQYKHAEEAYLKKLHSAIEQEKSDEIEMKIGDTEAISNHLEPSKIEIYKLEDIENMHGNASDRSIDYDKKVLS